MTDPIKQAMDALAEARKWFSTDGPLAKQLEAALSALQQAQQQSPAPIGYVNVYRKSDRDGTWYEVGCNDLFETADEAAALSAAEYEEEAYLGVYALIPAGALRQSAPAVPEGWAPTHRHVKRGTTYQWLGAGLLQSSAGPVDEGVALTIYRDEAGRLWARPEEEFEDGRFAALAAAPPPPEQMEGGEPQIGMSDADFRHVCQRIREETLEEAAKIAESRAKYYTDASHMGLPVEPSPIVAKDRASVAAGIALSIRGLTAAPPTDHPADVERGDDDSRRTPDYHRAMDAVRDLAAEHGSRTKQED